MLATAIEILLVALTGPLFWLLGYGFAKMGLDVAIWGWLRTKCKSTFRRTGADSKT